MNFKNQRFITKGVDSHLSLLLHHFMWSCIDNLPPPRDYLQVFVLSNENGKVKTVHTQEEPEYKREYLLDADAPFYIGKIFVIDNESHSTMLLANEY